MATQGSVKEKSKIKVKLPKKYVVIMHNDDFTPMDFVVDVLMMVFNKQYEEAVTIMMQIHKGKRGVVGTYSYDIARTKVDRAMEMARDEGHPFRVTMEEC